MDDTLCRQFFAEPAHPLQRRYEVLRACFHEERSVKDVADEFGMNFYTVRDWVRDFRAQCQARPAGDASPFLPSRHAADRAALRARPRLGPKTRTSPTAGN